MAPGQVEKVPGLLLHCLQAVGRAGGQPGGRQGGGGQGLGGHPGYCHQVEAGVMAACPHIPSSVCPGLEAWRQI